MSILLSVSYKEVISEWEGKAKGSLQVEWERCFIDEGNLTSYFSKGKIQPRKYYK